MEIEKPRVVVNVTSGVGYRRFVPSFTTVLLIAFFIICLLMNGDVKPLTRRGFFCNDSSINKPYHIDTIGIKTLLFIGLVLPCVIIKICDKSFDRLMGNSMLQNGYRASVRKVQRKRRKISDDVQEIDVEEEELIVSPTIKRRNLISSDSSDSDIVKQELPIKTNNIELNTIHGDSEEEDDETTLFTRVPLESDQEQSDNNNNQPLTNRYSNEVLTRKFSESQLYFFGLCTTMLLTGIGKITCGRLRPHFLQRCQPDVKCSELDGINKYIEEFKCTNSQLRPRDYSYITTSWPSGHASIMFYSMLYLIFYLNSVIPVLVQLSPKKVKKRFDPLVMYSAYVLLVGLAGFIALTRVSDYHHHPLDVLSGSILGSIIAVTIFRTLSRRYASLSVNVLNR